ncbi:hypothetical protein [Paenibacillus sp.]|nr:hypothetical protein [Paenibacillus sp.]
MSKYDRSSPQGCFFTLKNGQRAGIQGHESVYKCEFYDNFPGNIL